jgi:hypothetical protein
MVAPTGEGIGVVRAKLNNKIVPAITLTFETLAATVNRCRLTTPSPFRPPGALRAPARIAVPTEGLTKGRKQTIVCQWAMHLTTGEPIPDQVHF